MTNARKLQARLGALHGMAPDAARSAVRSAFDTAQMLADYRMLGAILQRVGYKPKVIRRMSFADRWTAVIWVTDVAEVCELNRW